MQLTILSFAVRYQADESCGTIFETFGVFDQAGLAAGLAEAKVRLERESALLDYPYDSIELVSEDVILNKARGDAVPVVPAPTPPPPPPPKPKAWEDDGSGHPF